MAQQDQRQPRLLHDQILQLIAGKPWPRCRSPALPRWPISAPPSYQSRLPQNGECAALLTDLPNTRSRCHSITRRRSAGAEFERHQARAGLSGQHRRDPFGSVSHAVSSRHEHDLRSCDIGSGGPTQDRRNAHGRETVEGGANDLAPAGTWPHGGLVRRSPSIVVSELRPIEDHLCPSERPLDQTRRGSVGYTALGSRNVLW